MTIQTSLRQLFVRRVLILGSGPLADALIEAIESGRGHFYILAGVVDESPPIGGEAAARWVGPPDRLCEIVERLRPACIVLAVRDRRDHLPLMSLLQTRVRGTIVVDGPEFYERLTGKMAIEALTPGALILCHGFRNHQTSRAMARALSVLVAAIGLVLVAPLLALVAAAIRLDSEGPVFFVQLRTGMDDRPFPLLKLRTMHVGGESRSDWVRDNEDRITRVGRWLRRFRIDELPQLINVLRGDMNLIGPRPHPTRNQARFLEHIAYYGLRSSVPPGITGWAQVRYGYANNLEEETEKMRYDLYYIKHRSIWLDTRIALATAAMVLLGRGATGVHHPRPRRVETRPPVWNRSPSARRLRWVVNPSPVRGRV
jgi:exopolysaccharide biosynthesis polyprenyl glycosylphosphotransferase